MPWVLIPFLLPLVLFAVVARRVIRVSRQFRDPNRLRSFLSDHVRAALLEAGFDPDSVTLEEIQESEELQRLVAGDLRRVLYSLILGRLVPGSGDLSGARHLTVGGGSDVPMHQWNTQASMQAGQPFIPPPIDQPSGSGIRAAVVLAIVASIAAAIYVASSQP